MNKQNQASKKMFDGLGLLIEAWEMLGLDKQSPSEFQKMKESKKHIGGQYGW